MSGILSSNTQKKLATLRSMADKVQHVHGLVERFATTQDPRQSEMLAMPMKRAFSRLKLELMGAGFDTLSQLAGAMEIAAGRGASKRQKTRILREGVGSLRFQVEQEQRRLVADDRDAQERAERERADRERAEREGAERERAEREGAERDRADREAAEGARPPRAEAGD